MTETKTREAFLYGGQVRIDELQAAGVRVESYYETNYCPDCSGAGAGCWCGNGLVEELVIEYVPSAEANGAK